MTTNLPSRANHSQAVDALRGFALLGIFLVNIQSYLWGLSGPSLGIIGVDSSLWDSATLLFIATVFEYKTYPIFCFCFGYGFAVLARKWRILGVSGASYFSRRLTFMLVLGLLHGMFIWFGDILARYAIVGFILKRSVHQGPRTTWKRFKFWFIFHIVITVSLLVSGLVTILFTSLFTGDNLDSQASRATAIAAHFIYQNSDYLTQTPQRIRDYFGVLLSAFFLVPAFLSLFLLGALTAQCRLLTLAHLPRVKLFWRRVAFISFAIGLPMTCAYSYLQLQTAANDNILRAIITGGLGEFGSVLAAGYIALIALQARASDQPASWFYRLFAPAGRVALSFYISQSLLMMLFLNDFFPAITFPYRESQFGLLGLAIGCYAVLLALAHGLAHYKLQGPLEMLWRRYTNASAQ